MHCWNNPQEVFFYKIDNSPVISAVKLAVFVMSVLIFAFFLFLIDDAFGKQDLNTFFNFYLT